MRTSTALLAGLGLSILARSRPWRAQLTRAGSWMGHSVAGARVHQLRVSAASLRARRDCDVVPTPRGPAL